MPIVFKDELEPDPDPILSSSVEPHDFTPLRWWDRFVKLGRCRCCYFPREYHPIRNFWAVARPIGDDQTLDWGAATRLQLRADGADR